MVRAKFLSLIASLLLCCGIANATGYVQDVHATASGVATATITITLTAGNMAILDMWNSNSGSTATPTITDNQGDVFVSSPYSIIGLPPGISLVYYCPNVHGGSTTISLGSNGAGTLNWDMVATEVNGMANHSPIFFASYGFNQTSNSMASDSLTLPAGTYYIYSHAGDLTSGSTYTGTAGFTQRAYTGNSYVRAVFDQTTTIGSPTTFTNTITSTGTYGGSSTSMLLAFSTAPNITSRLLQIGGGGTLLGQSTATAYMPSSVTNGNALLAFCNFNAQVAAGITDTIGNTWTLVDGGTSSDTFATYVTFLTSSGSDVVQCNAASSPSLQVLELAGVSAIDKHAAAGQGGTTNTSVTTASVTTTSTNEILAFFAGSQTGCNTQGIGWVATNFTWVGEMGAHCSQSVSLQQFSASTGSFSVTANTSPSAGWIAASLVTFKPALSGGGGTQPVINIITLNNKYPTLPKPRNMFDVSVLLAKYPDLKSN